MDPGPATRHLATTLRPTGSHFEGVGFTASDVFRFGVQDLLFGFGDSGEVVRNQTHRVRLLSLRVCVL